MVATIVVNNTQGFEAKKLIREVGIAVCSDLQKDTGRDGATQGSSYEEGIPVFESAVSIGSSNSYNSS